MRFVKGFFAVILVVCMTGTLLVWAEPAAMEPEGSSAQTAAVQEDQPQEDQPQEDQPSTPPSGLYEWICENSNSILFADTVTGDFVLRDRASGQDWYSSPPTIREDEITKGVKKTDMRSMLVAHYIEAATLASAPTELTVNSYAASVLNDDVTVELTDNGFLAKYTFTDEGFTVPVRVSLEEDGLHVEILVDEIANESGNYLTRFDLLPGFLAAGSGQTQGALFVPSGSGALVRFESCRGQYGSYSEQLYGEDAALNKTEADAPTQGILVPVYGIIQNDCAMAAIIVSGDSTSAILADGIGPSMGYNRVYSQYLLAAVDSTQLFEADFFNQRVIYAAESRNQYENYEVCFTPLSGDKGNLGGIAETYRQYLLENGVRAKPQEPKLGLTLYGAATRKASFLGIPYEKTFAMTTFDQAGQIVTELQDAGVDVALRYEGWTNAGLQNKKIPMSASPVKVLGGQQGYQRLLETLQEQQVNAYFDVDFRTIRKSGGGVSVLSDTIKTMFNTRSAQYRYMLSTGVPTLTESPWYMLRSTEIPQAAEKFAVSFNKAAGISLNGFGDSLYSDFNTKSSLSRRDCLDAYAAAAAAFDGTPLAVTTGNAYVYSYVERIFDLPQSHNGHLLFDESVPFVQMVLHGLIPYTSEAIDRATDPEMALLDCIAFGSDPYYIGIAADAGDLIETNFSSLYSTTYSTWSEDAVRMFLRYQEIYKDLYDQQIVDYAFVADGVSMTTFSDGTRIVVNRTAEDAVIGDAVVEGMNCCVMK